MRNLPKVVIVGRTNVGKSTLFNRLSTNVKSITLDYEGVTRDFVSDEVCWKDVCFLLIDSGGIALQKSNDSLAERVRQLALQLVEDAQVILFVCDGTVGVTEQDRQLAQFLHKSGKPVILVINKIDTHVAHDEQYAFTQLGFSDSCAISAQHGIGIAELFDILLARMPNKVPTGEEKAIKARVVLLGKPNVGKSSLMNVLLDRERVLVEDKPGTTREAITEEITFYQETIAITDTPGLRRKRTIEEPLEKLMVRSAFRAVDHADIVLLLIDGSQEVISDQELKLLFYVLKEGKALIILINKSDLMTEEQRLLLEEQFKLYQHVFNKVPRLYISVKTKKNVGKLVPLVNEIWQKYMQELPQEELSFVLKDALRRTPLFCNKEPLMLQSVRQIATAPTTILLKVNQPKWFGDSQLAFFENVLRRTFDLVGVPIKWVVKRK